jgi:hypothetical protein
VLLLESLGDRRLRLREDTRWKPASRRDPSCGGVPIDLRPERVRSSRDVTV